MKKILNSERNSACLEIIKEYVNIVFHFVNIYILANVSFALLLIISHCLVPNFGI